MTRRPVIGITPSPQRSELPHGTFYRYCLASTYTTAVHQAGGRTIILPGVDDDPAAMLEGLDGLILSGGGDIEASVFGQEPHPEIGGVDTDRDRFELALMRAAAERDLPTLAICRGIQVMGVAFGAGVDQHVPDVADGSVEHRQHAAGFSQHEPSHRVVLADSPNPLLDVLGKTEVMTNSFHHQALANVPEPLRLAGRAEDGTIEAIWHPGMRFGIGVQWHPEMLAATHEDHARLFSALVDAAQRAAVPA